jgi:hypothetical protein
MESFSKESYQIRRTFNLMAIYRGYNINYYFMISIFVSFWGLVAVIAAVVAAVAALIDYVQPK